MSALMQADEFQIAVVLQFDRSSTCLYVKDFLGEGMEEYLLMAQQPQPGPSWQSNGSQLQLKTDKNKKLIKSSSSSTSYDQIKDLINDDCQMDETPQRKKRKFC